MGRHETALPACIHSAIVATLGDTQYLVDVGFGSTVPTAPLHLDLRLPQFTAHEDYRLDLREAIAEKFVAKAVVR